MDRERASAARSSSDEDIASRRSEVLGRAQFGGGRLGTYTVLGAATGVVPLPWLPDAIARRVRGALVHDVTSRHGLSVTPEARKILIETGGFEGPRNLLKQGVTFVVTRVLGRFGPLAMLGPVSGALLTFALGHLLQRYLEASRVDRSTRIDVEEARRVRRAIDQALLQAILTDAKGGHESIPLLADDLRDPTTQLIDGALISLATAPHWLVRRLEAAFDAHLARA